MDKGLVRLRSFRSNVQSVLKVLKDKPGHHPGRILLAESLNALIEQEYGVEFEIPVPAKDARRTLILLLDLGRKLRDFGVEVSLDLVDGLVEDEKMVICNIVVEE